jgi:hypothetical protein
MGLKDLWEGAGNWLRSHGVVRAVDIEPEVDDQGLISLSGPGDAGGSEAGGDPDEKAIVKAVEPGEQRQAIEKLQEGFDKLIDQLRGINEHLNRQVSQNEDLMARIEKLPEWLESFPGAVENQKQITSELLEQLKGAGAKQQQFVDSVERIPNETAKQTDALVNIDHQLAAAADIDVQMTESFNKFNETLEKLNQTSGGQTESIMQMSKTFATSDRYLKYIIGKQNRRFVWVFIVAISVCVAVIMILAGIIVYLKQQ